MSIQIICVRAGGYLPYVLRVRCYGTRYQGIRRNSTRISRVFRQEIRAADNGWVQPSRLFAGDHLALKRNVYFSIEKMCFIAAWLGWRPVMRRHRFVTQIVSLNFPFRR
jgi:hypothetical protein